MFFVLQLFLFCNHIDYMYGPVGIVKQLIRVGFGTLHYVQILQSSPDRKALYLLWFPVLTKICKILLLGMILISQKAAIPVFSYQCIIETHFVYSLCHLFSQAY